MNNFLKLKTNNESLLIKRLVHYLRSQLLIPLTSHDATSSKEMSKNNKSKSISCLILENNGFISDTGTGMITYLPVGKRVINKLTNLIRNEMNKIQGQEIEMPSLSDLSLWSLTGKVYEIHYYYMRTQNKKFLL
jgi:prolyl-tRNA synthetase